MSSEKRPAKEKQTDKHVIRVGETERADQLESDTVEVKSGNTFEAPKKFEIKVGQCLQGKYQILEKLGSGGMGIVYKGHDLTLGRPIAVKVFSMSPSEHQTSFLRFQQEARAAGALNHEGIVGVHDFALAEEGLAYLVMDFVEGVSLAEMIARSGTLPLERGLELTTNVANALAYAHDKGVVHRDLKPANIMVVPGKRGESVKVVDFGIAKIRSEEGKSLTKTGEVFGSPLYMSPEQCTGLKVDQRTDIYSLACVLYEALVGRPPHVGENALATALMHLNEEPLPLNAVRSELTFPKALQAILDKALEKDVKLRYQSMSEFASDLQKLQQGKLDELVELGSVSKKKRFLNAVKQRLAILSGVISLVGASFCSNLTIAGVLYIVGGLLIVFSIPGLRGDGPVSVALKRQSRTTIPIGRAELIVWIILVPLLLGVVYFFWHHN